MATGSMTRTFAVRIIAQELRRRGMDVEHLASKAGLELRALTHSNAWIPFHVHAAFSKIAADASGDELFGLKTASLFDARDLGAIGYVGLSSRTFGEALMNLKRYMAVICDAVRIDVAFDRDLARVIMEPADPSILVHRHLVEFRLGLLVQGYKFHTKRKIKTREVHFAHHFEGDPREHERILECKVVFDQPCTEVILNRSDFALPIDSADDRLLQILITQCEDVLKARAKDDPDELIRLKRCIVDRLPRGEAKAKVIAAELGMSERSLVRHLDDMGTSFSEILGRLRHELALKYLSQPELSLTHISFLLGYANQSSFSTAFKRRTGCTPRDIRANAS